MTAATPHSDAPSLPADLEVAFLAEGAANIVYRLLLPDSTVPSLDDTRSSEADLDSLTTHDSTPPLSSASSPIRDDDPLAPFRNKLLRLRKDVSWIAPYRDLFSTQMRLINPLFDPRDIITASLVQLPENLVPRLNVALTRAETTGARPVKRQGMKLAANEPHGLLVTDMSPRHSSEILIEIKPKWLAQSPSAPRNARRCRTCALRAMKQPDDNVGHAIGHLTIGFCPLDLVSADFSHVSDAARIIVEGSSATKHLSNPEREIVAAKMQRFFLDTELLVHLKAMQEQCDTKGVLGYSEPLPESFLVATTLRDCTLFLRLTPADDGHVEGRLGDLDYKTPEQNKIDYWRGIETQLIHGEWYMGRGAPIGCRLER